MIRIENVTRTFRRAGGGTVHALVDVSVEISEGEFVCIVGPSGHGKTTLLQLVAGLLPPTSGKIVVDGVPVTGPGPDRGVVFQRDSVFPWMRVIDNVEYGLRCRGVPKERRRAISRSYLEAVGLDGLERSWPRELSGGMLKRVAVATVFATGAKVLLLDEPFGPLDYVTRHQLHDVLLNLWQATETERARTILFVTHDVDEALTLSDRILVVKQGRLVDDMRSTLPRPRTTDSLVVPEALRHKHVLLSHLGLEAPGPSGAVATGAGA
ncbi:MAG TPA: ABC transporter ATP-binding protein [Gaiellaceae bacterium]|nr:ABC transporter ATP-binding protein [Gaiellaceae bacterium]